MPDTTLSQAIQEAYASAPSASVILHTLEIWHSAFAAPIRVVRDWVPLDATLEASAPRDPGELATFAAFAFDVVPPAVEHQAVPQCVVELDNVSRDIVANIEAALAAGGTDPIEVIYRAYLSDDLSGPENDPPLTLQVQSITADVFRVRATCGFPDLGNRRFPGLDYSAEVFPGLVAQ